MNEDIVRGHWKEIKGELKKQWSKLTEDDMGDMQGTNDELEGRLQKIMATKKKKLKKKLNCFFIFTIGIANGSVC